MFKRSPNPEIAFAHFGSISSLMSNSTQASRDPPYSAEYQCEADDPYPNLGVKRESSVMFRWGSAEEATHVVGFPRAKFKRFPTIRDIVELNPDQRKEVGCELDEGEDLVPSEELPRGEYIHTVNLNHRPDAFALSVRSAASRASLVFGENVAGGA